MPSWLLFVGLKLGSKKYDGKMGKGVHISPHWFSSFPNLFFLSFGLVYYMHTDAFRQLNGSHLLGNPVSSLISCDMCGGHECLRQYQEWSFWPNSSVNSLNAFESINWSLWPRNFICLQMTFHFYRLCVSNLFSVTNTTSRSEKHNRAPPSDHQECGWLMKNLNILNQIRAITI